MKPIATYRDILEQLATAVVVVARPSGRVGSFAGAKLLGGAKESGTSPSEDASLAEAFCITYLNQAAQSLFGHSDGALVGRRIEEVLRDPNATPQELAGVLETGQAFTKRAANLVLGGSTVRLDYSIEPLSDTELLLELKPQDRFLRIDHDERQVSLQETTRKLARGLAHEVKNPLGGIRGAAQLLARQLGNEEQREYTSVIIEETDRLRSLVDRILGPSDEPHFDAVNVHDVIERVVRLLEAERPAEVTFKRDYDPSVPEVEGDLGKLVQATLNVLKNAFAAVVEVPEPTIVLQTRSVRQFTIGSVRHRLVANMNFIDNGPGIPADIEGRLFYPMISGRPDGSGLGLAITQTIVGQHNGVIEHESQPGRTAFSFYLPVKQVQGPNGSTRQLPKRTADAPARRANAPARRANAPARRA
ncbi:MAG: PAS domain-containing protein [Gammaproteobacteria bacterium]|nr:PAS domain-containing protein [Gammaproteobacteria bacterium]